MKILKIFLAILFLQHTLIAQKPTSTKPTLVETQQWIKDKIESFPFIAAEGNFTNNYTIEYSENKFILKDKCYYGETLGTIDQYASIILPDIQSVVIKENGDNIILVIKVKEGKVINCKGASKSKIAPGETNNSTFTVTELTIHLSMKFGNDNLPDRMKKAFSRLIELSGGKPTYVKEAY